MDRNDEQDLIADLLVAWEEAYDEGKDISAEELCTECPHLTSQVKQKIEDLRATAWIKKDPARPLTDNRLADIRDLSGTLLSTRYRLDSLLGRGGYGQVYRAYDLQLHRNVAVKIGHARTTTDLLLDEARRVARFRHNSIVQVHDVGEHEGRFFLVFELIEGRSLAELIREKPLSTNDAVDLIITVAEALQYAHKQGCIHRDIKPENILIDAEGKPLIADFGVACTLEEIEKGRALSSGTLAYMAPEQVAQETQLLDGRCDVHALGVLLFELLTGKSPFESKSKTDLREQILFRQPKKLRDVDANLPQELEMICSKCLQKHPDDRYQTARELSDALRGLLEKSKHWNRRNWLFGGGFLMLLTAIMGFAAAHILSPSENYFDGNRFIKTDVERQLPVTLEAWIKPEPYRSSDCQFVIGSDIPTKYGVGIAICGSLLSAEHMGGMINSNAAVSPGEWSHVAGVFTESETRLYLNGHLVATGKGGQTTDSTKFVLGRAGESNPIDYFRGEIGRARISKGEQYTEDFRPAKEFVGDDSTLYLFNP